jgi:hypothetical protein
MLFIETSIFTKQIKELVSDDEYRELQQELLVQPDKEISLKMVVVFEKYVVLKAVKEKVVAYV